MVLHKCRRFFFYMARKGIGVEADVCVMKESDDVLLVHVDSERSSYIASLPNLQCQQSSAPQIIAGAIAAYYQNNFRRMQAGLPLFQSLSCLISLCSALLPSFIASSFCPSSWRLGLHRRTPRKKLSSSGSSRSLPIRRHKSLMGFVPWTIGILFRSFQGFSGVFPFNLTRPPYPIHFRWG